MLDKTPAVKTEMVYASKLKMVGSFNTQILQLCFTTPTEMMMDKRMIPGQQYNSEMITSQEGYILTSLATHEHHFTKNSSRESVCMH